MPAKKSVKLAADLAGAERQFTKWRRTRKPGARIPERLWASAVKLAASHGLHPTASALRLDYHSAKQRLAAIAPSAGEAESRPAFGPSDSPASSAEPEAGAQQAAEGEQNSPRKKGHGRNGADVYAGAEKIEVQHESLRSGDACPDCLEGIVYATAPGVLVRIKGQAPLGAKLYQLQKFRCNLCGEVSTAQPPEGVGSEKYDATAASISSRPRSGSRSTRPTVGRSWASCAIGSRSNSMITWSSPTRRSAARSRTCWPTGTS